MIRRLNSLFVVAALSLAPIAAHAGGLFIPGAGAQAQGRAGAFVAKADDPSAMLHNPAGVAKGHGTIVHIGVNLVDLSLRYTRTGSYEAPTGETLPYEGQAYGTVEDESSPAIGIGGMQAIPLIAVTTDLGMKKLPVRFGFGILAPQAYPERDFAPSYTFQDPNTPPPPQRYDVMSQEAATIMPSMAVAYTTPDGKLNVGLRATWGIGELKGTTYVWGIRNYEEWIARDGEFNLDVSDNFVPSMGLGVLYRVTDSIEVGAAWNSGMTVNGKGTGSSQLGDDLGIGGDSERIVPDEFPRCEEGGTPEAVKACVTVKIPQTVAVGARWVKRDAKQREVMDVELDVRWEQWSAASDYEIVVDGRGDLVQRRLEDSVIRHGFQDVFSVRLGGSYSMPMGSNWVSLRAGIAHDTKTAPVSWNRLDIDGSPRTTIAGGLSWQTSKLRIDVGGGVVLEPDRTVGSCNPNVASPGCDGSGTDTPVEDRVSPDPVQPLSGGLNQVQSPFNAGTYESGYVLLHLGVTTWF